MNFNFCNLVVFCDVLQKVRQMPAYGQPMVYTTPGGGVQQVYPGQPIVLMQGGGSQVPMYYHGYPPVGEGLELPVLNNV